MNNNEFESFLEVSPYDPFKFPLKNISDDMNNLVYSEKSSNIEELFGSEMRDYELSFTLSNLVDFK